MQCIGVKYKEKKLLILKNTYVLSKQIKSLFRSKKKSIKIADKSNK